MSEEWEEEALSPIEQLSKDRREKPLEFFREILSTMFQENTVDGALAIFRTKAQHYRAYAGDVMACLDHIVDNPPAELIEIIGDAANLRLNHVTPTKVTRYSYDETVAWLCGVRDKFRAVYAAAAPQS
jgi:hypothetical protein